MVATNKISQAVQVYKLEIFTKEPGPRLVPEREFITIQEYASLHTFFSIENAETGGRLHYETAKDGSDLPDHIEDCLDVTTEAIVLTSTRGLTNEDSGKFLYNDIS